MAKDFGAEGLGDKTDPVAGMPSPMEQAYKDRKDRLMEEMAKREQEADKKRSDKSMMMLPPSEMMRPKKKGGMKKGGSVSSASKRADGCAQRGKTRGKMV